MGWSRRVLAGLAFCVSAVAGCVFVVAVPDAQANGSFTWSGNALPSDVWSIGGNWVGGSAPSAFGDIASVVFPALVPPPAENGVESTADNLTGAVVDQIVIDDGTPYGFANVGGFTTMLGAGGIVATTTASEVSRFPEFQGSVTLKAPQTWSVDGGGGGQGGLAFENIVSGSEPLTIVLSREGVLAFNTMGAGDIDDDEVGDVTVTGATRADTGLDAIANGAVYVGFGAGLDALDGETIELDDATIFGEGILGPVTSTGGLIVAGDPLGGLGVNGPVTLDASSAIDFAVADDGATPGEDYSQLDAVGDVDLGDAALDITGADANDDCPTLAGGTVDTLVVTAGAVRGTFAQMPNGSIIALDCTGPTDPVMAINYTIHAVTATALPYPTHTTLTSNESNVTEGQQVTLTATVAGPSTPLGTVTFASDASPIANCTAVGLITTQSSSTATCTTSFAAAGSYALQATFQPAASAIELPSESPSLSLPVSVPLITPPMPITTPLPATNAPAPVSLTPSAPLNPTTPTKDKPATSGAPVTINKTQPPNGTHLQCALVGPRTHRSKPTHTPCHTRKLHRHRGKGGHTLYVPTATKPARSAPRARRFAIR